MVLPESVEDLLKVLQVICPTFAENEDVIKIYDHKIIGGRMQYIVHQSHESCWSISQAKRHDQPFKKTLYRLEGSLPNIGLFDWDLLVARFQINFAKELGSLELVKEVINSRDWVPISDCDFFKGFVIDTESPYPIILLH